MARLFAGIARGARKVFDVEKRRVHVDSTSFSVSGEYGDDDRSQGGEEADGALIGITHAGAIGETTEPTSSGGCRLWRLPTRGHIPLFLKPLDGNSSDRATLVAAVEALKEQPHGEEDDETAASIFVADGGLYSEANMSRPAEAGVRWGKPSARETSETARSIIDPDAPDWRSSPDGRGCAGTGER